MYPTHKKEILTIIDSDNFRKLSSNREMRYHISGYRFGILWNKSQSFIYYDNCLKIWSGKILSYKLSGPEV